MKRKILSAVFLLFYCFSNIPVKAETNNDVEILFTCDLNARVDEDSSSPGFLNLTKTIDKEKTENTILLDAGNSLTGSYYETIYDKAPIYSLFTLMGYDVIGIGSNDLQYGAESFTNLLNVETELPPLVTSNVVMGDDVQKAFSEKNGKAWTTIEKNGVKVGIFSLADSINYLDLTFSSLTETATSIVSQLNGENCDVIVCLSANNLDTNKQMINEVDGIDLLISSGDKKDEIEKIKDTAIVSVGQNGQYLGKVNISNDGSISSYEAIEVVDEEENKEDQEEKEEADIYADLKNKIKSLKESTAYNETIGTTKKDFSIHSTEQLISEAIENTAQDYINDFDNINVLLDENDILSGINNGNVTKGTIYNLYRHDLTDNLDNQLVVYKLQGKDLYTLQEYAIGYGQSYFTYHINSHYANYRPKNSKVIKVYLESNNQYWALIDNEEYVTVASTYGFVKELMAIGDLTNDELSIQVKTIKNKDVTDDNLEELLIKDSNEENISLQTSLEKYIKSNASNLSPGNTKLSLQEDKKFSLINYFLNLNEHGFKFVTQAIGISVTIIVILVIVKMIYSHMHNNA